MRSDVRTTVRVVRAIAMGVSLLLCCTAARAGVRFEAQKCGNCTDKEPKMVSDCH